MKAERTTCSCSVLLENKDELAVRLFVVVFLFIIKEIFRIHLYCVFPSPCLV